MGLYLQNSGVKYVIYEKGSEAGMFWRSFPAMKELISVNTPPLKYRKKLNVQGSDLRYDWHSLLNTPVDFRNFSTRFFPQRSEYQAYLKHVASSLNVVYNTEVVQLQDGPCVVVVSSSQNIVCAKRVFVATGLEFTPRPELDKLGIMSYEQFENAHKNGKLDGEFVCVLGNGNSAWEMAQASVDKARATTVYGRRPTRWSFVTKYAGDVRIKYGQPMENFHSKLLSFTTVSSSIINGDESSNRYDYSGFLDSMVEDTWDTKDKDLSGNAMCSIIFHAWGFQSKLIGQMKHGKDSIFPEDLGPLWYESRSISGVHYIGWHMHKNDFRQGSGGFARGFRYLIRNLWKWVKSIE